MLKNATFLSFYLANYQLFSNSETLVNEISNHRITISSNDFFWAKSPNKGF
jgi:hypothetical protein